MSSTSASATSATTRMLRVRLWRGAGRGRRAAPLFGLAGGRGGGAGPGGEAGGGAGRGGAAVPFDGKPEVGGRGRRRGDRAEEEAGAGRPGDGEQQRAQVEADAPAVLADARQVGGVDGQQRPHADDAEDEAA